MKYLHGVTTAMITPFEADGALNTDKLARLADFLIAGGVDCLYPLGTTGEMLKMKETERMEAARTVVEAAAGRCTVYVHTGAADPQQVVRLSRHAAEIGADGIGVVTPAFFGMNYREMVAFYEMVSKSVPADFPIYLYNIPQCSGNDITVSMAAEIARLCPNVAGIKYSWADMIRTYEYLNIRDGKFQVVQGTDRLFLPALAQGCAGTVSGISCVYPEPFVKVYSCWKKGDVEAARMWQRKANRIAEILKCGSNLALFKAALAYRGLFESSVRGPQLDISGSEYDSLIKDLETFEKSGLDWNK